MKVCHTCGCYLTRKNTSGYCRDHRAGHSAPPVPCSVCASPLPKANTSGLCATHYAEHRLRGREEVDERIAASLRQRRSAAQVATEFGVSISRVHKVSAARVCIRPTKRLADIVRLAASHSGLTPGEVKGSDRHRPLVAARQAVCLVGVEAGHSTSAIGVILNGRDHSTVIHGRDAAAARAKASPDYAAFLDKVRAGVMPPARIAPQDIVQVLTIEEMDAPKRAKLPPLPAGLVERATRRRGSLVIKAKNDFHDAALADEDSSHAFHRGIAAGSLALRRAIERARAPQEAA